MSYYVSANCTSSGSVAVRFPGGREAAGGLPDNTDNTLENVKSECESYSVGQEDCDQGYFCLSCPDT